MTLTDHSTTKAGGRPAISPLPLIIAGAVAAGVGTAVLAWFRTVQRERPLEQRTRDRLSIAPATLNNHDFRVG